MEELLKNINASDIEKMKMLMTMMQRNEPKEIVTLRVLIEEYKNVIQASRSSSYLRSIKLSFNHLIEYFTIKDGKPGIKKSVEAITLKDVEYFMIYLQQKVKKGYSVYFKNLKAAFNKAKEWGYVNENYFNKIKLPKKQKIVPVFLDSNQLSAISNQIKNKNVKDVVWFAFYTGMRIDELVNLKWKNVDLLNKVITVGDEQFVTKGKEQRFIPICDEAERILIEKTESLDMADRRPEKKNCKKSLLNNGIASTINTIKNSDRLIKIEEYVFSKSDRKKYSKDYFSKRFKCACIKAGANKSVHFHSLRHSFASNLAQKGVSLYIIKELLGHASISTTEIYSHLNMNSLREAVEKLGARGEEEENILPIEGNPYPSPTKKSKMDMRLGPRSERQEKLQAKIFRIDSGELK